MDGLFWLSWNCVAANAHQLECRFASEMASYTGFLFFSHLLVFLVAIW